MDVWVQGLGVMVHNCTDIVHHMNRFDGLMHTMSSYVIAYNHIS